MKTEKEIKKRIEELEEELHDPKDPIGNQFKVEAINILTWILKD